MVLVLLTFNDSLFTMSHSFTLANSLLIPSANLCLLNAFVVVNKVVSSAYIIHLNTLLENTISFMYNVNKSGPNIDPCGTPVNISALSDKILSY